MALIVCLVNRAVLDILLIGKGLVTCEDENRGHNSQQTRKQAERTFCSNQMREGDGRERRGWEEERGWIFDAVMGKMLTSNCADFS